MALAASLIPGYKYRIISGDHEDMLVTIMSNKPFPDDDPQGRQRKVETLDPYGRIRYVLPRQLEGPVSETPVAPLPKAAAAPVVPQPIVDRIELPAPQIDASYVLDPITDPMDDRLDHLRPRPSKVRRYINRIMPNGQTDVEFLLTFTNEFYRQRNEGRPANIMLMGDTQSGKTLLVEVIAVLWSEVLADEQRKAGVPVTFTKPMPIWTLSGSSGVTDYDLFGSPTTYTDPTTGKDMLIHLPGILELAARIGGILYVDECNALGERVTSTLHPATDHRHEFTNRFKPVWKHGQFMPETISMSLDSWVIGTYNEGNYRGMMQMNEAFTNRFRHIEWGYDEAVEAQLIKSSPAIRLLGQKLRLARAGNQLKTPCGTAALMRLEEDIKTFGIVMGISIFKGMFQPGERPVVDSIIEDGSILVALEEERRQASMEQSNTF